MHFFNWGFAVLHMYLMWSQVQLYQVNFQILVEYLETSQKENWLSWCPLFINPSAGPSPILSLSWDLEKYVANTDVHVPCARASLLESLSTEPSCLSAEQLKGRKYSEVVAWVKPGRIAWDYQVLTHLMWGQIHFLGYEVSSLSHCLCFVLFNYFMWKSVAIW